MAFFTNGACRIYTPTSGPPLSPKFGQGGGDDRYRGRWIFVDNIFNFVSDNSENMGILSLKETQSPPQTHAHFNANFFSTNW